MSTIDRKTVDDVGQITEALFTDGYGIYDRHEVLWAFPAWQKSEHAWQK